MRKPRHSFWLKPRLVLASVMFLLSGCQPQEVSVQHSLPAIGTAQTKVVFLAGPDSHLPGAHEHQAGTELLATALRQRKPTFETVSIIGGWPADESVFDGVDALVMYCDGGESHLIIEHLATFNRLLDDGVGIVALHYCVEVPQGSPAAQSMLRAIG